MKSALPTDHSLDVDPHTIEGGAGLLPQLHANQRIRVLDEVAAAMAELTRNPNHPEKLYGEVFARVRSARLDEHHTIEQALRGMPGGAMPAIRDLVRLLLTLDRQRATLAAQLDKLNKIPRLAPDVAVPLDLRQRDSPGRMR